MAKHRRIKLTLRTKATVLTVAITSLSLMAVAAVGVWQMRTHIATEQRRAAESVAQGIARASELAVAVHDKRELSRITDSFLRDENILFIATYTGENRLLAKSCCLTGCYRLPKSPRTLTGSKPATLCGSARPCCGTATTASAAPRCCCAAPSRTCCHGPPPRP